MMRTVTGWIVVRARLLAERAMVAFRTVAALPARGPRPLRWLCADPNRLLTLAWLTGLIVVGTARSAAADGIIVGPDLAHGAPRTLFESYDFIDYKLTVKPDDEASGWFSIGEAVLEVIGFLNNLIMWLCLGILYGALTLLQWLLNLTLYRDAAGQVDLAVQSAAASVFWPLIGATAAVGAFVAYARWRGEGRGFVSDLGWVVAAGTLAVGFAAGPSTVMSHVDGLRQDLATGIMSGAADYSATADSPTGFQTPPIGGARQESATRRLTDNVWNTFGATAWCYAQFRELDICKAAGSHALANDATWQAWMKTLDDNGNVPEFREHGDWIRGQDMTRTGYLVVLALITIPTGLLLLRLVIAGLTAAVGFLLMLVIGLLFVTFWAIPGWFRDTGLRYAQFTLGMQLQSLLTTALITGFVAISVIIGTAAGQFGFFVVATLNLGLLGAAARARAWGDSITTVGGAGGMGYLGAMVASTAIRGAAGVVGGVMGKATGMATSGARAGAGAAVRKVAAAGTHVGSGGMRPQRNPWLSPLAKHTPPKPPPTQATATRMAPDLKQIGPAAQRALPPGAPTASRAAIERPDHVGRTAIGPSQRWMTANFATADGTVVDRRLRPQRPRPQPAPAPPRRVWMATSDGQLSPLGSRPYRLLKPPGKTGLRRVTGGTP